MMTVEAVILLMLFFWSDTQWGDTNGTIVVTLQKSHKRYECNFVTSDNKITIFSNGKKKKYIYIYIYTKI